jgi:2-polyprenyl-3-methyl-5-hydroxy-6-metoxy-1,4-benzoquinol methylase
VITIDFDRLKPEGRLLDIGCGPGRHTAAAARLGWKRVVGADQSAADLTTARRRLLDEGLAAALTATDIRLLPFRDGAFHAVVCAEVLEHIPDHRQAVKELVRVLAPGGRMAISVPRYLPERICWMLSDAYHKVPGGHIRIYRKAALIRLLTAAGLTPADCHGAHALHGPYWWLKCAVGPDRDDVPPVEWYHRLLVREMMGRSRILTALERILNPWMGKSLVVYFRKPPIQEKSGRP